MSVWKIQRQRLFICSSLVKYTPSLWGKICIYRDTILMVTIQANIYLCKETGLTWHYLCNLVWLYGERERTFILYSVKIPVIILIKFNEGTRGKLNWTRYNSLYVLAHLKALVSRKQSERTCLFFEAIDWYCIC